MSAYPAVTTSCCPRCGGACESNWITITLRRTSSEYAILRNVPAEICQLCGETQFSMPTSLRMLASLQSRRPGYDIVLVPIYDYLPSSWLNVERRRIRNYPVSAVYDTVLIRRRLCLYYHIS